MNTSLPHNKKIYSSSEKLSAPIIKTFLSLIVTCVIIAFSTGNSHAQVINTTNPGTGPYATIQLAIDNAATLAGDVIQLTANVTEPIVIVNKSITFDGAGFTMTSTSPSWGLSIQSAGVTVQNLTIDGAGTFGLHQSPGSDNLTVTNTTVQNGGGSGFALNCSNNVQLTGITSTNNVGNGVSITDVTNVAINGITTSGNTFGTFGAGIGIFSGGGFCAAGSSNISITGAVNISEVPALYEQSTAGSISGVTFMPTSGTSSPLPYFAGVGTTDKYYAPDLATAYASAAALLALPVPSSLVHVEEVATGNKYVDNGMSINAAIAFATPGVSVIVEAGTYNENVVINKELTLTGANSGVSCTGTRTAESIVLGSTNKAVDIQADNVTFDGFTVTNPLGANGIYTVGYNDLDIIYNIVTDIGDPAGSVNNYGIIVELTGASGDKDNINISENCVSDVDGSPGFSTGAIVVGFSTSANSLTNLTINNNVIDDIDAVDNTFANGGRGAYGILINVASSGTAGVVTDAVVTGNEISDLSGYWVHAIGLEGNTPGASVMNNTIDNLVTVTDPTFSAGVFVEANLGAGSVNINNNSLTNMAFALANVTATNVNATCNWYGVTGALVTPLVGGSFTYEPFLSTGADISPAVGFQETPGSCTGCASGNIVQNTNTSLYYCTIQAAIDDPLTLDGHTISAGPGTYSENVVINKELSLTGANFNVSCCEVPTIRTAESIITGPGGSGSMAVKIEADNVTINGFTISNPLGSYGIYTKNNDHLDILHNIVTDIGDNVAGSGSSYGIIVDMYSTDNTGVDDINISNNCVNDIRGGDNVSLTGSARKANNGSAVGIGAGFSESDFDLTNLVISGNNITNINATTIAFADGGKGAYGVLLNVGAKVIGTGKIIDPLITTNEITDLEGLWAHGIGLEGETPGALVTNNIIDDLTDHKGGTDAVGVLIEQNDGASTVEIHENSYTNMVYGIVNLMPATVDATCNWYGSASIATIDPLVAGDVTYIAYLNNGTDDDLGAKGFQPVAGSCCETPPTALCQDVTVTLDATGNGSVTAAQLDNGSNDACSAVSLGLDCAVSVDQSVTPNVIFGSGNTNGSFTTNPPGAVELGLRAKVRYPAPANTFNSNGDGTYSHLAGPGSPTTRALWNFEWTINSDPASGLVKLDELTYELGIDFDKSCATNFLIFDPINLACADHAIGNNSTGNGLGTSATCPGGDATYSALIAANNVAQNSWNLDFFDGGTYIFDPNDNGTYDFYLKAFDANGILIAKTTMSVIVGTGAADAPCASPLQLDYTCADVGLHPVTLTVTNASGVSATCNATVTVVDAPVSFTCPDVTANNDPGLCTAQVFYDAPSTSAVTCFQGFEDAGFLANTDPGDWNEFNSSLTRVVSGTGGVTSATGAAHGLLDASVAAQTGSFTRLCGYSSDFGFGFTSSLDVYMDLNDAAVVGNTYGWDLTTAATNQSGGHLRDFIFHTASNASGQILVGGSNNTNFTRRNDLAAINHYTITSSGWYTFQFVFKDVGGVLEVDLNLVDAGGTVLWTETRNNASDLIATIVGGNRYMWFTFLEVGTLAIDNTTLTRISASGAVSCVPASGSVFPVGSTPVTCTAVNACGTVSTCSFNVIVKDTEAPNAICQDVTVTLDATGNGSVTAAQVDNGSSDLCGAVSLGVDCAVSVDQNATPEVIFGSGNANGSFTTNPTGAVELGLRAKVRYPSPANTFNSNGDGTYSHLAGPGSPVTRALWNFEWTINSDPASGLVKLDELTYELGIDFDASCATNFLIFDPIFAAACADHAIGNNSTGNGAGTSASCPGGDAAYAASIAANNVAQNSWNMDFFDGGTYIFDPNDNGTYDFYLKAFDANGILIGKTTMTVIVGTGATDAPCALPTVFNYTCADAGIHPVTLTVTDVSGNTSTCTANVTVVDAPPIALCQDVTVTLDAGGNGSVTVAQIDNGSSDLCGAVSLGLDCAVSVDQNATPEVIFGSGNANGSFTTNPTGAVELGLRAKVRYPSPANTFNSNGDGTYSHLAGPGSPATRALWNFEWTINSDPASGLVKLDELTYELGIDFDASCATNFLIFDPINLACADHAIGNNSTGNGAGTSASCPGGDAAYAASIAANNVAQNSWNMDFFDGGTYIFDPNDNGTYDFYLKAFDANGILIAKTTMTVIVGTGGVDAPCASPLQLDYTCADVGLNPVTLTVTDVSGNTTTCNATVTVVDAPPISFTCPDVTANNDPGSCTAQVFYDVACFQGFEDAGFLVNTDPGDWQKFNSNLTRVVSGTGGVTSATGAAHGLLDASVAAQTGAYTRLCGYSSDFGFGFTSSLDVYMDLSDAAVVGNTYGWDLTTAATNQSGGHLRDFIFHTASNASGQILVGGSNNTNFTRRNDLAAINHYTITSSGWYTFQFVFKDVAGVLAVDLNLVDAGGTVLWTETRTTATDLIATIVGGNRYMWFTFLEVDMLAIDNTTLTRNIASGAVTCVPASGSVFPVGSTPVTCTAVNACGTVSTCTFNVIVKDTEAPNAICQDVTVTLDATGNGSVTAAQVDNGSSDLCSPVSLSLDCAVLADQNATPEVIFGSGNANGSFTTNPTGAVELGLRAKVRYPLPANTFNSNGDGTYSHLAGAGSPVTRALWNFEWTINTDPTETTGLKLDDLTYELGIDFEASNCETTLAFDPIDPAGHPFGFWDHAIGDNATGNGGGTSAPDAPTYLSNIATNNVAQNSWNLDFFDDAPFNIFDPTVDGTYTFHLKAFDGNGLLIAKTTMTVIVGTGGDAFACAPTTVFNYTCADVGLHPVTLTVTDTSGNTSTCTANVTVLPPALTAGLDNSVSFCTPLANAPYLIDLNALLSGADTGGNWAETTSSGIDISNPLIVDIGSTPNGTYIFTYTVNGGVACPNDEASIIITITKVGCSTFPWDGGGGGNFHFK